MARRVAPLTIRNAQIIFKNFSGKPDRYHPKGDSRSFCVIISDPETAQSMADDGWNIRALRPREDAEDDGPVSYVSVKVSYDNYPPNIYMISGRRKVALNEDTIGELDHCRFIKADVRISPYTYIDRETGDERLAAYCRDLYATVEVDELAEEYADYE